MTMLERRKYKRFDTEGSLILKPEDGTNRTIKADLISIGFGGITTVNTQEKVGPGVSIKFELFSKFWDEPVTCEGRIIHTEEFKKYDFNGFRSGIEFTKADATDIQNILSLIQRNIIAEMKKRHAKADKGDTKKSWL